MAKPEWGIKRTCQGCGSRFYDLLKTPISCPECGSILELLTTGRGKKNRAFEEQGRDPLLSNELDDDKDLNDDAMDLNEEDDDTIMEDDSDLSGDDDIPDILDIDSQDDDM